MVKKYRQINDSDGHSDIDSTGYAEMNAENTHSDNRGSNTNSAENVDSPNNVRRSSRARNPPIRFGEAYTHCEKLLKVGRICGICNGLWMNFVYMEFEYGLCI